MNKYKFFSLILFSAFVLFACQRQDASEAVYVESESAPAAPESGMYDEEVAYDSDASSEKLSDGIVAQSTAQAPEQKQDQSDQTQERLIIRTGNLSITVADTEKTIEQITNLVNAMGGWVVSSNAFQYGAGVRGTLTVRFPAQNFSQMGVDIKSLALEVNNESSSGQDVTDEFVDLGSRLTNLEATADRVRAFLDDTKNVEEALAVNVELSRLEGDIEVIKGRMQYLSQSAAFSTLTIELWPDEVAQPIEIDRWLPFEVAEEAIEALARTMQGLANFVIWLAIYILPVGLVVGVPLWFLGRWIARKFRARRNSRSNTIASTTETPAE
ncbi:MAG: hypothetical protein ACI9EW_001458 [Cellvibrionaceae bacterium]|jgi:hypothetical protein